ncbi:MAG: hypothetical protein JWP52_3715 [Rhizobacter sp.]|nr:hypothetical protein [Rhizobacter sp.]
MAAPSRPLQFDLHAAGALAPGVASLSDVFALRRGEPTAAAVEDKLPAAQVLPPNERRRASQVVRLSLACAEEALRTSPFAVDQMRLVFASDEGTGEVCQQMLESLALGRDVSPLVFHNSVHNAPSGYFSIGHQNRQAALSVSLGAESFASGLLCAVTEALTTHQPVLFVAYDAPMPPPLRSLLPIEAWSATAWVIAACSARPVDTTPLATFDLDLGPGLDEASADAPPAWLPASWAGNSSAWGFVALALLDEPGASCRLALGRQWLRLSRAMEDMLC